MPTDKTSQMGDTTSVPPDTDDRNVNNYKSNSGVTKRFPMRLRSSPTGGSPLLVPLKPFGMPGNKRVSFSPAMSPAIGATLMPKTARLTMPL
jgi:hypothetical protein